MTTKKRAKANTGSRDSLKPEASDIALRVVLQRPPAGVEFGLQKGRGSAYETIQKQRSQGDDLQFVFAVTSKTAKDGAPDFAGPFVQGPSGERFVYIDIGTYAGQTDTLWSRRLKVSLAGIDWAIVKKAKRAGTVVETKVNGTGKDGGPACASVRPAPIWKLK